MTNDCNHVGTIEVADSGRWVCNRCGMSSAEDPRIQLQRRDELADELQQPQEPAVSVGPESTKTAIALARLGARVLEGEISMLEFHEDRLVRMVAATSPVQVLDMLAMIAGGLAQRSAPLLDRTSDELLDALAALVAKRSDDA